MKKIIAKKTYNTDTAIKLGEFSVGYFGDPEGYQEILYKTKTGNHFVYGIGGAQSVYPQETIKALTNDEANEWLANHAE